MAELTAADIMTRDVRTVPPGTPIDEIARLLATEHVSGIPVVEDDGRLIGIVSEGDLIARYCGQDQRAAWWLVMLAEGGELAPDYVEFLRRQRDTARNIMSRDVIAIGEGDKIGDIAALMVSKGVNRVPVVKDGHLVGIVTRADLVRAMSFRPPTEEHRGFVDQTSLARPSDHPVLDSDKLQKEEHPDRTPRRRGTDRPLFP